MPIILSDGNAATQDRSGRDPGSFAVEDFMTEQQEAEILTEMEPDTPQEAISPGRGSSPSNSLAFFPVII
jgi:hypothetical protein